MRFNYTHYDLGFLEADTVVEVTLKGSDANVQLLDDECYDNFKAGKQYICIGGLVTKSPVRMKVPFSKRWHVTVDMRGLTGTVQSSVRVLANTLPEYNPQ